jgi:RNA polymerase sigma-B factor
MRRCEVPSRREEELRLLRAYHATGDPRAREAAVERFLPLARSLARRYRGGTEPLEDLEQVACLALVRAVDGFDPSRGTAFTSYAVPSIAGALKRHFRDNGWSVRVPRDLQELALRVERLKDELMAETGHSPTAVQIAVRAGKGIGVEDVLEARDAFRALHSDSLDQPRARRDDDEAGSLLDTLGDADLELGRAHDRAALDSVLDTLDERDRTIIHLYYQGELTQAEIGRRLGYSQMHVSRLLRQAVERLQLAVAEQEERVAARVETAAA